MTTTTGTLPGDAELSAFLARLRASGSGGLNRCRFDDERPAGWACAVTLCRHRGYERTAAGWRSLVEAVTGLPYERPESRRLADQEARRVALPPEPEASGGLRVIPRARHERVWDHREQRYVDGAAYVAYQIA